MHNTDTMTPRERFHAVMHRQPFDRLPLVEWAGWWDKTLERWYGEGLPRELTDRYAIARHLGVEVYKQGWLRPRAHDCPQPAHHGAGDLPDPAAYGRLRKHLFPWPVVDRARWEAWAVEQARGEVVLWFSLDGFFWFPRTIFGIEQHLYAFYDHGELMHAMNDELADWMLRVIEEICSVCTPDFMTFAEDMSYNHGPMLSRELFDEFMLPYYRRVVPRLRELGVIPVVDSDGDITEPVAWFEEAGVGGMLPLERQAGVDVQALQGKHPGMAFIGCFDKMCMHRGEAALRAEFERLLPVAANGGLVISCDHQTPPGVSLRDYRLYLRLFQEYACEAGRRSRQGAAREEAG